MEELVIVFRDESLIAISKPAGLLVHRSPIDRHETRFAIQLLRDQIGQQVYPAHRLDKPTSGVLLFALNAELATVLMQDFAAQRVNKRYQGIVRGHTSDEICINHPLSPIEDPYALKAPAAAQDAVTLLRTVQRYELALPVDRYPVARYSYVELQPQTGRQHQLRRHLKHIAHPLIGDVNYGKGSHNRFFREHFDCYRLLLHCCHLQFRHPLSGEIVNAEAALPPDFADTICRLNTQGVF